MASVFLSYDHQDSAKARLVALALEKRGHDVWWDRHIHGGAQYAKEIEQAIARADTVVVLWSRQSVESEWVRDEAMAGKARGRLVPASIDGSEPPIGFRQFQVIDLATARGRKWTQGLEALDRAIAAHGGDSTSQPIGSGDRPGLSRRSAVAAAVVALLVMVASGLFWWKSWMGGSDAPIVTVEARDSSAASAELANSLLVQLGSLQSSRGDLLQLGEPDSDVDPDLVLKVASGGNLGSASVALIDSDKSTLLWAKEFGSDGAKAADLRQQVAYATAKALECAAEGSSANGKGLDASTFKLYLNSCAELSTSDLGQLPVLIETFRKITSKVPKFAGGWAGLLKTEIDAFNLSGLSDPKLRRQLQTDIAQARKFHPDLAETYMAEGWLQVPRPIAGWMRFADKAVEVDPNNPDALLQQATGMFHVGRMKEAIENSRKAVQFDPLSANTRNALMYALVEGGENEAARRELSEVERLWPGSRNLASGRFMIESRIGDARKALAMAQSGELPWPVAPVRLLSLEASAEGTPQAIERAIQQSEQQYKQSKGSLGSYLQALVEFGRDEQALQLMLSADPADAPGAITYFFRPTFDGIRRDPRFMIAAKRFGLIDYWQETGKWADFCSRPGLSYDCKAEAAKLSS